MNLLIKTKDNINPIWLKELIQMSSDFYIEDIIEVKHNANK